MQPSISLNICEFLSMYKPSGVGQWLRVQPSLVAGMAFLFSPALLLVGVVIVRLWGSYSVTRYLQGHSWIIIVLMNQPRVSALACTPIGSS